MIEFKKGDLLREDAEALVNTVNCVGIMGRESLFNSRMHSRRISTLTLLHARAMKYNLGKC